MKAINLYVLTRNTNKYYYSVYENVLAERREYKPVKEYEYASLLSLVDELMKSRASVKDLDGFFYTFAIEQIGKEFDLLKIWNNNVILNIELKSEMVEEEKIEKQLKKNLYYLQHVAPTQYLFTYIQQTNKFFVLENDELKESSSDEVVKVLRKMYSYELEGIDELFRPKQFLISPLNTPEKFLDDRYFLTQQQGEIKAEIINNYTKRNKRIWGITGTAGTGKTLLLYDLAKTLGGYGRCCVIHCGILCEGHNILNKKLTNVWVIDAKTVTTSYLEPFDFILVDEAQRIYPRDLQFVLEAAEQGEKVCIFSYDYFQILAYSEENNNVPDILRGIMGFEERRLSTKIRCNKEMTSFVKNLLDLNDRSNIVYRYNDVEVIYADNEKEAKKVLQLYTDYKNYVFIGLTQSKYYYNSIDRFPTDINTHHVIGQEFDKVIIMMDENFKYGEDGKLKGKSHPNPNYIFYKLLYQGLSRAREKLCILVVENNVLFEKILSIKFKNIPGIDPEF